MRICARDRSRHARQVHTRHDGGSKTACTLTKSEVCKKKFKSVLRIFFEKLLKKKTTRKSLSV